MFVMTNHLITPCAVHCGSTNNNDWLVDSFSRVLVPRGQFGYLETDLMHTVHVLGL